MPTSDPEAITLAWYVQAVGEDATLAQQCASEASELVAPLVGAQNPYSVPESVIARAVLEVGADLFYRKASRNGIVQFDGVETSSAVRISRDPLSAAYPFLRPYMPMGLG